MSQLKRKSPENAVFDGFSGIDARHAHSGKARSRDICNFRICENGALKKRNGYLHTASFSESIRAVWTGIIYEKEKCFVLNGKNVCLYDQNSNSIINFGTVGSSSGRACFFYYRDRLYLADGSKIYEINPISLTIAETIGYIPLIGKNWQTGKRGEQYEKRNLLCDRGRISYKIEEYPTIYLHTGWLARSIEAVYLNGTLLPSSQYTYNTIFKTVEIMGLEEGDEVLIYVVYAAPEDNALTGGLFSCTAETNFGYLGKDRIFMWGGVKRNMLYCSELVPKSSMDDSLNIDSKSSPLYFPFGYEFTAGDGRHNIQAAIRHYDRLLIFTDGDAWNAEPSVNGFADAPLVSINQGAGCASMCAVTTADNCPISVGKHTIFSWNSDTDEYNECNATSISAPIDSLLSSDFYKNALVFHAKKHGELWFYGSGDQNMWIYNIKRKAWYRFTSFLANGFFELNGDVWFYDSTNFYRFDDNATQDIGPNNTKQNISAVFLTDILEFSTDDKKRLDSLVLRMDASNSSISVNFTFDKISTENYLLNDLTEDHSVFRKRLHSGRFKYATMNITSRNDKPVTIHSIEIGVR